MLKISANFDGGAIEVVDVTKPETIRLRLRSDNAAEFKQWFYFRLQGAAYRGCSLYFENAADATYPDGWLDYQAVASYDRKNWFRVPTRYDEEAGQLVIEHTPLANSVYYAYFEPYSYEQHLQLLGEAQGSGLCQIDDLGNTVEGRDINLLTIGNQAASDLKIWIIARQHPGETMAEWLVEGLLDRLLDYQDATARALLDCATFYIVPNMNPDGAVRGNLRTNACGVNLNRVWNAPDEVTSPEVYWVRQKMADTGVDLFLDIHGDEALPYVFVVGTEGVPSYRQEMMALEEAFKIALRHANPDFQDEYGYPKDEAGQANLGMATAYVGQTYRCLAFTLEMPFKDNAFLPNDDFGWNGQRSLRLGESLVGAIWAIHAPLQKYRIDAK